jgi:hypothetical protein
MARKQKQKDLKAARERKQKIFLVVGGVAFVALAVFQGPKLWKQMHPSSAAPAATAAAVATPGVPGTATPGAAPTTPSGAAAIAARAPKGAKTELAGIVIVTEQPAEAGEGQLDSFSRFSVKDPFVQQVNVDVTGSASTPPASPAPSSPSPSPSQSPSQSPSPSSPTSSGSTESTTTPATTVTPQAPVAPTMAFIKVNGKLQRVDLKGRFPSSDRVFVLRALTGSLAKIAVAGGSFAGRDATLTLRVGHAVTLVNTATGVRYVVRLLFVGSTADRVAGFSAK